MGRKPTSAERDADLWEAVVVQGLPVKVVAQDLGMSVSGAYSALQRLKKAKERLDDMASKEKPIAGDKRNGRLYTTGEQGVFRGTCILPNGKVEVKRFVVSSVVEGKEAWREWCDELRRQQREEEDLPEWCYPREPAAAKPDAAGGDTSSNDGEADGSAEDAEKEEKVAEVMAKGTDGPIYALVIGEPRIAGYFTEDEVEKALMVEASSNAALEFAGVDIRCQLVEIPRYRGV